MRLQIQIFLLFLILLFVACGPNETSPPVEVIPTSRPTLPINEATAVPSRTAQPDEATPIEIEPTEDLTASLSPSDKPRTQQMVGYLNGLVGEGRFMGSVLVAQGDRLLLNEGFGSADLEARIPNSPDYQYRIGSLTKQFTAAAILLLQEDGLLNVQDPVRKYLPDYPNGDQITIHQLLIHTAGIPNYEQRRDLPQVVQTAISLDDLIASFSNQPLQFSPGQRYSYSSSGYVILTKIIEVVSGTRYEDFIQDKIFTPAGMQNSGYDYLDPAVSNPSVGYMLNQRGAQRAILTEASWPTGAGAHYSTLGDLYRWDRVLYENSILSAESIEMMNTPWVDTGQGRSYGYGWNIGPTIGRPSIAHGGSIFGFASYMLRFPEDDAVIIVLSNGIQVSPRMVAEALAAILFAD